ncbi:SPASM domain-containing protein [Bradyrhizobium sp. 49]|nr:SPASM domain-containing protein [Bradyrhizobium sp. 84]MCK1370351.1 SPASM domain-containing protein [Bradyrhizobium sp. 49]
MSRPNGRPFCCPIPSQTSVQAGGFFRTFIRILKQGYRLRAYDRHVHRQSPCAGCWARYLCGGGCYHEVTARGRPACEFIRGWLHFVLQLYLRLTSAGSRLPLRADVGMGH